MSVIILLFILSVSFLVAYYTYMSMSKQSSSIEQIQIKCAVDNGEFEAYFQPLVDAQSKAVIGVEVLVRWIHPIDGIIQPDLFVPLLELNGTIVGVTSFIMNDVANFIKENQMGFQAGFHVGFNISAVHLESDVIIKNCQNFQAICPRDKFTLVLELTERSILKKSHDVVKRLYQLSCMGVQLALDDFGVGYSSLVVLHDFHFNYIKIDKSFVATVDSELHSRHIVEGVIFIAKKMNIFIVAEGVETKGQEAFLQERGVDFLQGYRYAKPLEKRLFLEYLRNQ